MFIDVFDHRTEVPREVFVPSNTLIFLLKKGDQPLLHLLAVGAQSDKADGVGVRVTCEAFESRLGRPTNFINGLCCIRQCIGLQEVNLFFVPYGV